MAVARRLTVSHSLSPGFGGHYGTHAIDAPFGVRERAVLFEERGARQEDVCERRCLVVKQILHDEAVERSQRVGHVLRVRIGLREILALNEQSAEFAADGLRQHVRNAQTRIGVEVHVPPSFERAAHRVVGDVAIARKFVRKGTHVARALHVVLAAQRIHADAVAADVAGCHGEVRESHHHGAALAVFGHAEAVVDRRIACARIQARRKSQFVGRYSGECLGRFGRVFLCRDERSPALERFALAAFIDERFVDQTFGDDDVGKRIDQRDVRSRAQLQMMARLDVRAAYEIDPARIGDDQLRPFAQPSLEPRGEHRMRVRGVRTDHHDDVGVVDGLEILRSRRRAERLLESIAGRRVADACTRIDVVVAERRPHHLLHDEHFLVRAARRGDSADRMAAVSICNRAEALRRKIDGFVPRHFAPWLIDALTHLRFQHAVAMCRVTPRETPLHAGMTVVRSAVGIGLHADQLVAFQFRVERTADAAIRAGRLHDAIGLAVLDDGFFDQRGGGTRLHARAARHAFGIDEAGPLRWRQWRSRSHDRPL